MTGADPNTCWPSGCVALDYKGFILVKFRLSQVARLAKFPRSLDFPLSVVYSQIVEVFVPADFVQTLSTTL